MRILLTNDDGLFTNGMLHLEEALRDGAEVWCIAPDRERSATSQALSLRETLLLKKISDRRYTVNGYPTDCVNIALFSGEFPRFDLVISGINHGVNLGDDIHYSGTVGAARHATLHGHPAIAMSCPIRGHDGDFRRPAAWLAQWIKSNLKALQPGKLWNINYPEEGTGANGFPEVVITRQGRRIYQDRYELLSEGEGSRIYKLLETTMGRKMEPGTDFDAFESGRISLTPITTDTTDQERLYGAL
ncbi:MAG: 5'/3'-nucleotidase SurE [Leptospirales bacterium]|nr:5'/3'-nucleotidase SurE [Leptospirales bacterium]